MQERQNRNQLQWFDHYQPSKTVLFWACAAMREMPATGKAAQIGAEAAVAQ